MGSRDPLASGAKSFGSLCFCEIVIWLNQTKPVLLRPYYDYLFPVINELFVLFINIFISFIKMIFVFFFLFYVITSTFVLVLVGCVAV